MATTYQINRVERKGVEVFIDVTFFDDTVGEFSYGRWLKPAEVAMLNADETAIDTIIAARLPSALVWREQTKAAEEYALAHPEADQEG